MAAGVNGARKGVRSAVNRLAGRQAVFRSGPGSRNVFVALALVMLGCDNVALYDGSLAEWTADPALPMETDFPQ